MQKESMVIQSPLSVCDDPSRLQQFDPSQAILDPPRTGLAAAFNPRSVAVIGATDRAGSVGSTIVKNLLEGNLSSNMQYSIFPVNPTREKVLGLPCYKSIELIKDPVDLAVIVLPSAKVADAMKMCGLAKVRCAVIISAGFKEMGEKGLELENEVIAIARKYHVRVVGPNCLGIMNPNRGLNATFASCMALKGSLAFASQSGAMCTAVLDWSRKEGLGFSSFVSIGSMADVEWGDLIDYLGRDPNTKSILIYMETVGNAKHFLSAAKEIALSKPIIVIKAGKTEAAANAAASHTGSLAGSHDAFVAAMKRVGVLLVDSIGELFNCALVLGKQPRPKGPRLTLITNAGGPGVLATDAVAMNGALVADVDSEIMEKLNAFLPNAWSHGNPIDILGDANAQCYAKTLNTAIMDPNSDGVLVILSPQSVTEPTATAKAIVDTWKQSNTDKPIFASFMGGKDVQEGFDYLNNNGIPTFSYPDAAAKTFAQIWSQTSDMRLMTENPSLRTSVMSASDAKGRDVAISIIKGALAEKRLLLTEAESKKVVKQYGIPVAETLICPTLESAREAALSVGFPCVVKLHSETITHKSDVGGVKLNIKSVEEVVAAFASIQENVDAIGANHFQGVTLQPMIDISKGIELIYGSISDPQFGPLCLFGMGGCFVEVFKDTSLALPPLNATLAQRLIESTKIYKALKGGQGERFVGVNMAEVTASLVAFSQMICDLSEYVSEIDLNPMLAMPDKLVALDARVVLRSPDEPEVPLAIRPYPKEYTYSYTMKNGSKLLIRPTEPNDVAKFIDLHQSLSESTIKQRYLSAVSFQNRIAHEQIVSVCQADYARMIALVAEEESSGKFVSLIRITRMAGAPTHAEFKMVVTDDYQGQGIGRTMLSKAIAVAQSEGIKVCRAIVLQENSGFFKLAAEFNFVPIAHDDWVNVVEMRLTL